MNDEILELTFEVKGLQYTPAAMCGMERLCDIYSEAHILLDMADNETEKTGVRTLLSNIVRCVRCYKKELPCVDDNYITS